MNNKPGLIANYTAVGVIAAHTFASLVTVGEDDTQVATANGTGLVLGVTADVGAADGGRVDVVLTQITPVIYGGNLTRGEPVKSDANGHAVLAEDGDAVCGQALQTGLAGELGSVLLR
ncbi:DUF2190 family protein [Collimonas antrihumi]|uniref:DUF2190 family protein n=1 Tax=Collimonas antrihumi TaxID=1940615 RepID=UPI001B8B3447|nr:DUF2190 family protein [Collimonas antrihumi]